MVSTKSKSALTWIFILAVLLSGYLIRRIVDFNPLFITLLTVEIIVAAFINWRFNPLQVGVVRSMLGLLFIFSGFVKGVDPIGTQYRIADYFIAFGTEWAIPYALPLAVILNASEFVLGAMLLFNIRLRITTWLVMIMMAFFTVTTFNDALYNPVPDCGCFGDAIILSNWQTFYKNLVIVSLLMIVFFSRNRIRFSYNQKVEYSLIIIFTLGFVWFEIFNIRHLPLIDFRDWKVGNKKIVEEKKPLKYYLTYKNRDTGKTQEYLSPNYPYDDSAWMSKWEFVKQRVIDPNPKVNNLAIEDEEGNDVTDQIIANPDFQFMLISYDINRMNTKKTNDIRKLLSKCNEDGYSFVMLTSSIPEEVHSFLNKYDLDIDYYFADDVSLEAMIRANPGLVLLKNGVVLGKWHYNDFPSYEDFKQKFVDN